MTYEPVRQEGNTLVLESGVESVIYELVDTDGRQKQTVTQQLDDSLPDTLFTDAPQQIDRAFYTREEVADRQFRYPRVTLLLLTIVFLLLTWFVNPSTGIGVGVVAIVLFQVVMNNGKKRYEYTCVLDPTRPVGDGTQEDPYLIEDAYQLSALELDSHAELITDINATRLSEPLSSYDNRFTGVLDGNGHVIRNLSLNYPDDVGVGLFGYVEGATIRQIGFEQASITGQSLVGTLAGKVLDSEITNVYATGTVTGDTNTGGLLGLNEGHVTDCLTCCEVRCDDRAGGVVGNNEGHTYRTYSDSGRSRQDECTLIEVDWKEESELDFESTWRIGANGVPQLQD